MSLEREVAELPARVRADFPILERRIDDLPIIYLDSSATSLKPRAVVDAMVDFYTYSTANIHRGKHYLSEEASTRYEESRYVIAQYIGAFGNEVVFVRNTTEALNVVAMGLGLCRDDLVVATLDAHHSQLLPWRRQARVEMVRVDAHGRVDLDQYEELLREQPRVVALCHCSNVTGVYAPIDRMVRMAKQAGALTVVDAAQSIPHRRVNVADLPVDFLAFSAHKMLGPTGVGVLYGRREQLDALRPAYAGGGAVDWVDLNEFRLRKIPHRFEAGTPDIAGAFGFAAAVDYLRGIGPEALEEHDAVLSELMQREAAKRSYLKPLGGDPSGDRRERAAILSLQMAGVEKLTDVARMLSDAYGIMCRSGHLCAQPVVDHFTDGEVLRASAYLYNTKEDILRFFEALDEIEARLHAKPR